MSPKFRGQGQENGMSWKQRLATLVPILTMLGGVGVGDVQHAHAEDATGRPLALTETLRKEDRVLMQAISDVLSVYGCQTQDLSSEHSGYGADSAVVGYYVQTFGLESGGDNLSSMQFATALYRRIQEQKTISPNSEAMIANAISQRVRDAKMSSADDSAQQLPELQEAGTEFKVSFGDDNSDLERMISEMLPGSNAIIALPRDNMPPAAIFVSIDQDGQATLVTFAAEAELAGLPESNIIGVERVSGLTIASPISSALDSTSSAVAAQAGQLAFALGAGGNAIANDNAIGEYMLLTSIGNQRIAG